MSCALNDVTIETRVEREPQKPDEPKFSERLDPFNKGEEWRGTFIANQTPAGVYRMTATASRDGKVIGRDSSRFLVYEDDRELENPAADRDLLRKVAEASGGESIAPEQLVAYIQNLKGKIFTEAYAPIERKVWDNWPFLLLFTALLMLEWAIRKRHGWV